MRAIWKGHISFGLVNIPVGLFAAEERTDLQLHMIDSRNHARVRYERVNAETGEEVPWDRIVKGYEYGDGNYVVLQKEDLERAAPEATKAIEIDRFVDLDEIDSIFFDKPYYLEPGKGGEKPYALLREAIRESNMAGIATIVIRTRQHVCALTPRGDGLMIHLLRFAQEIRDMSELDLPGSAEAVGVKKQELKMASDLIKSMEGPWDPSEYHDEYREQLRKWIDERIASGDMEAAPQAQEPRGEAPEPINLMEALKKSLGSGAKQPSKQGSQQSSKKTSKKGRTKKKAG